MIYSLDECDEIMKFSAIIFHVTNQWWVQITVLLQGPSYATDYASMSS